MGGDIGRPPGLTRRSQEIGWFFESPLVAWVKPLLMGFYMACKLMAWLVQDLPPSKNSCGSCKSQDCTIGHFENCETKIKKETAIKKIDEKKPKE